MKWSIFAMALFCTLAGCGQSAANYHVWWDVSNNGKRFIYSVDDDIFLAHKIKGDYASKLVTKGENPCFANVNGTKILFNGDTRIWSLNLGTGAEQPITTPAPGYQDNRPVWIAKARKIVFVRYHVRNLYRPWQNDLYSCNFDGTSLKRLSRQRYFSIRISPQSYFDRGTLVITEAPSKQNQTLGIYPQNLVWVRLNPGTSKTIGVRILATDQKQLPHSPWMAAVDDSGRLVLMDCGNLDETSLYLSAMPSITGRKVFKGSGVQCPLFGTTGKPMFLQQTGNAIFAKELESAGTTRILFKLNTRTP